MKSCIHVSSSPGWERRSSEHSRAPVTISDQRCKEDPLTVPTESELATAAEAPAEAPASEDFDLDIRFAESGPVIEELLRPTDDNCGHTCESACTPTCP